MIGARKPKLPLVSIKTTAIIIAAKIIIFMTRDNLPGSVLTKALIIKYRVAAPRTKKTKILIMTNFLYQKKIHYEGYMETKKLGN